MRERDNNFWHLTPHDNIDKKNYLKSFWWRSWEIFMTFFSRFRSAPWQKLWSDKVAMSFRQVLKRRKSNWQKCCSSFLFASCWLIYQHFWSKRWVWRKFQKFRILKFDQKIHWVGRQCVNYSDQQRVILIFRSSSSSNRSASS